MIAYDSAVLFQFADGMYRRARQLVISQTVVGVLFGALVGIAGSTLMRRVPGFNGLGGLVAWGVGAAIAYSAYTGAQTKAFALRLEAQRLLCQATIEQNTRK